MGTDQTGTVYSGPEETGLLSQNSLNALGGETILDKENNRA